jgi:hypothetical protein
MPIGKCPLCLNEETLVRSHLIPQAVYDYCRTKETSPVGVVLFARFVVAFLIEKHDVIAFARTAAANTAKKPPKHERGDGSSEQDRDSRKGISRAFKNRGVVFEPDSSHRDIAAVFQAVFFQSRQRLAAFRVH